MGLLGPKKKSPIDEAIDRAEHAFDESFREELRTHGRDYFEKVITESASVFKKELDAATLQINVDLKDHVIKKLDTTISRINIELKEHVTKQLDGQFAEYSAVMKEAEDAAISSQERNSKALEEKQDQLTTTLQKSIANQGVMLDGIFQENMAHMGEMKKSQEDALKTIQSSVKALEDQYKELSETLKQTITKQEDMLVSAFQDNMARIIEHYLLDALGDQYDLKAQLPSIIKQMEANKEAIVDDMKL